MSTDRQSVSVRDLVEEAKKRVVFLIVCVVGMSYLMSLTSTSVLVNLPASAVLIIIFRYWSLESDMRRKAATYKGKPIAVSTSPMRKTFEVPRVTADESDWKRKVDSPVVEDAIDHFTRHIMSEWVTDLWYSRITPDRQGPEELVQIMNGVLGEFSYRMRDINLINLLTRDIIDLLCTQLELFRSSKAKIEKHRSRFLTIEERELELKSVLAAENKLHPALFSSEAEHKVLQHIMDGLISFTFKPGDLQCSLFRYIVRELLSCAVMRPVLNLSSPRFINERIEFLVISLSKTNKGSKATRVDLQSRPNVSPKLSSDHSQVLDPSMKGVELVQLKKDRSRNKADKPASGNMKEILLSKDSLLSSGTHSTPSWSPLPSENYYANGRDIQRHLSGGEWVDMLDVFFRRKTEALAPEHFDNMWTKGRNYKKNEGANQVADPVKKASLEGVSISVEQSKMLSGQKKKIIETEGSSLESDVFNTGSNKCPGANNIVTHDELKKQSHTVIPLNEDKDDLCLSCSDEIQSESSSYTTEDEDTINVTGIDSPDVIVWDAKNKRNVGSIHHPLESFEGLKSRKASKGHLHSPRLHKTLSKRKRSRSSSQNGHLWQEVERASFLLGDRQDILYSSTQNIKHEDSSDDFEAELLNRVYSGANTSSSVSLASLPGSHCWPANSAKNSIIADSFFKLRCEVLGANIVKSGSKTFAVYSISVTDVNSNSWSIKRRFRHFEELHRLLKEFREYNLHLPPKYFLSTGLEIFVIEERCKLLDQYLKKLLQLPTVSSSIEVWDFLSVDSQTYFFSNSLSILETLSVDLDDTIHERSREYRDKVGPSTDLLSNQKENFSHSKESALRMRGEHAADASKLNKGSLVLSPRKIPTKGCGMAFEDSSDSDNPEQESIHLAGNLGKTLKTDANSLRASEFINAATDPTLPSEWVPPNLSVPILDLVDVIFQLQDGGWIRRKAFWVAKQILQLGMGDAFDDWLIEKIQILRRGSVVASGIRRLEQILWPDGIFVTKHPKRQQPTCASPSDNSPRVQSPTPFSSPNIDDILKLEEMQQKEAERRAKLVYELMIDKAPSTIVGLVGHKEYEKCAKDLYYFIQSSVCMKQLAFKLLELLLLSAFPELDNVFKQLHEEKEKFGKLELN